ncbi:hypothetical protein R1T16_17370 [Flavobacterium sp. DG1-102-2]|uniref:hypothetical protein n=1 Tax=Flavobacterium sp. DG1-102-2 TaxID=3081663 RepID=UPI00294A3F38|nr:hypothetical protein [Flavobacterium sp. DG1-102-2]MDV6170210.1 hypothetical protein [Flavobacterium sp. DG1-102-2]
MKVELKLTADELQYMAQLAGHSNSSSTLAIFMSITREKKTVMSICIDVADKFEAKYKALSRKATLFDAKKKHKISLKYHEAYAVNAWLETRLPLETDPYRKSICSKLSLMIDPKL